MKVHFQHARSKTATPKTFHKVGRSHVSLTPRLAPAAPRPREAFANKNVTGIPSVDADYGERAAIAIGPFAQDLHALTGQQLCEPMLRVLRQIAFIGTLSLDFRSSMLKIRIASASCVMPSRKESPSQTRISVGSHDNTQSMMVTVMWLLIALYCCC